MIRRRSQSISAGSGARRSSRPDSGVGFGGGEAESANSTPAWVAEVAERRRRRLERERDRMSGGGEDATSPKGGSRPSSMTLSPAERGRSLTMDSSLSPSKASEPEWKRALREKRLSAQLKEQDVRS